MCESIRRGGGWVAYRSRCFRDRTETLSRRYERLSRMCWTRDCTMLDDIARGTSMLVIRCALRYGTAKTEIHGWRRLRSFNEGGRCRSPMTTPPLSRVVNATHYAQHVRKHVSPNESIREYYLPRRFSSLLHEAPASVAPRRWGKRNIRTATGSTFFCPWQGARTHCLEPDTRIQESAIAVRT